jgi:hypothetical protein
MRRRKLRRCASLTLSLGIMGAALLLFLMRRPRAWTSAAYPGPSAMQPPYL